MPESNPYFQVFVNHPVIKTIADTPKWTISDSNKRPIDMFRLRMHLQYGDPIYGASMAYDSETETLREVLRLVPNASNLTFSLDARRDRLMVLDIEPSCPDDIKRELLQLPYLYGEVSSSGKGYHLLLSLPDRDDIEEVLNAHSVLKEPNKYYEFLLCHWCMFTGRQIAPATGNADVREAFDPLYEAAKTRSENITACDFELVDDDAVDGLDDILYCTSGNYFEKTVADYGNDWSRYEFYQINKIHKWFWGYLQATHNETKYTVAEIATILYRLAQEYIEHRPKHDTVRCGEPYLLYMVRRYMSLCTFGPTNSAPEDIDTR